MAIVTINDSYLSAIGAAIRGKNGETTKYVPADMAAAITNLPTGSGGGDVTPFEDCNVTTVTLSGAAKKATLSGIPSAASIKYILIYHGVAQVSSSIFYVKTGLYIPELFGEWICSGGISSGTMIQPQTMIGEHYGTDFIKCALTDNVDGTITLELQKFGDVTDAEYTSTEYIPRGWPIIIGYKGV